MSKGKALAIPTGGREATNLRGTISPIAVSSNGEYSATFTSRSLLLFEHAISAFHGIALGQAAGTTPGVIAHNDGPVATLPHRRTMSAAGRKHIAIATKARWAEKKRLAAIGGKKATLKTMAAGG